MPHRIEHGERVRHRLTGRVGEVVRDKRPRAGVVMVRFDGDPLPKPCNPQDVRPHDGDGR